MTSWPFQSQPVSQKMRPLAVTAIEAPRPMLAAWKTVIACTLAMMLPAVIVAGMPSIVGAAATHAMNAAKDSCLPMKHQVKAPLLGPAAAFTKTVKQVPGKSLPVRFEWPGIDQTGPTAQLGQDSRPPDRLFST